MNENEENQVVIPFRERSTLGTNLDPIDPLEELLDELEEKTEEDSSQLADYLEKYSHKRKAYYMAELSLYIE